METKAALYRMAQQNIAQYRLKAEDEAKQRKQRLLQLAPSYETLRLALLRTQIESARQAAAGEKRPETQELMDKLQQQLQALLEKTGFSNQDLLPSYHCTLCKDTGRFDGRRCTCVEAEMRRLRRQQLNGEFPLELCRFDRFSLDRYSSEVDAALGTSPRAIMTQVLEYCQAYAAHFKPGCTSLLMMGNAGLGKTHLALAMAGCVLDKGYDVVYVSAQQAFAALDNNTREGQSELWLEAMLHADLLILDDLGTEYIVPHTISMLYEIVNTRLCAKRSTVYTTNIVTQTLMNNRYTEKVASRLLGGCEILQFFGEDIRLQDK